MDPIKEAFAKAKQDILNLQSQIESLKQDLISIKRTLDSLSLHSSNQQTNQQINSPTPIQLNTPTNQQTQSFQHTQDNKTYLYGLKSPYKHISTGNGGVPTNQPTNQQTNQRTGNEGVPPSLKLGKDDKISHIERVSEILNSLDSLKKEIRSQFKRLTPQELSIFSTIYDLEEKGFIVDYSLVSQKLSLSEISIRDYIRKLIIKGIPIIKTKENNKKIIISIAPDLKKIASLQTILMLREL